MKLIELKPCPFCGGKAEVHEFNGKCFMAYCSKCACEQGRNYTTEKAAIKAWNKRYEL